MNNEKLDSIIDRIDNIGKNLVNQNFEMKSNIQKLLELNERNMKLYTELENKLDKLERKSATIVSDTIYVDNVDKLPLVMTFKNKGDTNE